ncbi:hypothetical protein [Peribacillus butanolivorans]|uniref:hypothetical protein n=1 Tax=Peribacillus butanolivorans TaxID=421767 RepID=UPI003660800E
MFNRNSWLSIKDTTKKKKWDHRPSDNNVEENILNQEVTATHPNGKWVTDITELKKGMVKKPI